MTRICICPNMEILSANRLWNLKLIGLCCLIHELYRPGTYQNNSGKVTINEWIIQRFNTLVNQYSAGKKNATTGIYFIQDWYKMCVPSNEPSGTKTGRVFLLRNNNDKNCNNTNINELMNKDTISIDMDTSGIVYIQTTKDITEGSKFQFHVEATCQKSAYLNKTETEIIITAVSKYQQDVRPTEQICFDDVASVFTIEENSGPQPLGILCPCCHLSSVDFQPIYSVNVAHIFSDKGSDEYLTVDNNTTMLWLRKSMDREKYHSPMMFTVTCVANGDTHKRNFTLIVSDVNDNGPYFAKKDGYRRRYLERHVLIDDEISENVEDKDTLLDSHTVSIIYDPLGVCQFQRENKLLCFNDKTEKEFIGVLCDLSVKFNKSRLLSSNRDVYVCNVTLVDTTLESATDSSDKVIMEINIYRTLLATTISRSATTFARVHQFQDDTTGDTGGYHLRSDIFGITHTGILFIKDVLGFRALPSPFPIHIYKQSNKKETNKTLLITIVGDNPLDGQKVDWGCSQSNSEINCLQNRGMGSSIDHCEWRKQIKRDNALALHYSTCSPSIKTCPDLKCDELEELSPHICPQDCTPKENLYSQVVSNGRRGIKMANGPCVCDYNSCICDGVHEDTNNEATRTRATQLKNNLHYTSTGSIAKAADSTEANRTLMIPQPKADLQLAKEVACDEQCRTTVAAAIGCGLAVVVVTAIVCLLRRHRCGRRNVLKHVGSAVSISVLPSDYVDDRDRQVPHTAHSSPSSWSPKGPPLLTQEDIDEKWEFSRDNLILEGALGEGEFGQVIQARAFGIDGKQEYRTVAIKMLKNCAAPCERHDLMSEMNLLKDVNHPNVIRLLGSCTYGGPLYVIVEHCENGSLLSFLRRSRLQEAGFENHRFRHRHHAGKKSQEDKAEIEILTMADLLSFAWQIARGMQYLSEMKLVHRDLAARNILVASGRLLKISDFGLTRDVYEADAYHKKSKGRIPVKWLAPESLYARIYTTYSDVWSYGIVLWETCTLGAPPYPGIPPERLYNLLIGGYRMDRPEYCTDEMYAVMQKCWKCGANDRPTFAELVDIFDGILEERTDYLDLDTGRERRVLSDDLLNMESNNSAMDTFMDSRYRRSDSETGYGSMSVSDKTDTCVTPTDEEEKIPLASPSKDQDDDEESSKWAESSSDSEKLALLFDSCSAQFSNICSDKNSERYGGINVNSELQV